ncbi:MAG: hypothetical protein P4K86_04475 [Terracidiphilus sp.]|nr:hypothetical protein [Terracidiphilus sp.]
MSQVSTSRSEATANSKASPAAWLPYMAEYKIVRVQVRAGVTSLPHESRIVTARDAQGRQMAATTEIPAWAEAKPVTHFHVFDPMAHLTFTWSFPGKKATVTAIPFYGEIQMSCGDAVVRIASMDCEMKPTKVTLEELGTKTIEGIEARGRRTTWTTPSEYVGKDKKHKPPVCPAEVSTTELWKAMTPGLTGLVARQVSEDAQTGKYSKELVKFSQREPDAAVFRPPAGYEIVNREVGTDPCINFEGIEPFTVPNPVLPQSPEK